jgi:hypothetical protein
MNVIEASSLLFSFFEKNDSFCTDDDFNSLRPEKLIESDKAAIMCALESFKDAGMVKLTNIKSRTYYVLSRPFNSISQQIELSAPLALHLSNLVNKILELNKQPKDSNPLKLTERDIAILLQYITSPPESINKSPETTI